MASKAIQNASTGPANGIALLLLAAYLAAVTWKGNLGALWSALYKDLFEKGPAGVAFYQWIIGLAILWWLANKPETSKVFEPLLYVALVALLIQLATKQPNLFKSLNQGVARILGGS